MSSRGAFPSWARLVRGAGSGLLAGAAGVAFAQLLGALIRPESAPLVTVGGAIVDATPTPVKEFAVAHFGTHDKLVLSLSIVAGLAAFAAGFGIAGLWRRWLGYAGATAFAVVGIVAAISRPAARSWDFLPAAAGGLTAIAVLALLLPRALAAGEWRGALPMPAAGDAADLGAGSAASVTGDRQAAGGIAGPAPIDRRAFLRAGGLVAVATGVAVVTASAVTAARQRAASALRAAVRLPRPASPAPSMIATPGFYTANAAFYRVDTALSVPRIDPDSWRLRIHGLVGREISLDFAQLAARPAIERDITLNCVSNQVGGPYIGTARWLGIPLAPLLREAGVHHQADQIVARSVDGMTIGTPVATALDGRDTMLAIGMNGQPLPLEHGFPVRMLTPGLYGYVGACKWLVDLELTTFAAYDPYWVKRGWARQAPVKTSSRIGTPKPLAQLAAGPVRIAGVAWAQHRGIQSVQVQVDDGPWQAATLLPTASTDTWVQWTYTWTAASGQHQLRVRATDGTGTLQTQTRHDTFPNGSTGWHTIVVIAS